MKKNRTGLKSDLWIFRRKTFLAMKFILLFIFCSFLQAKAELFSQRKVSIQMKEVALDQVFRELSRQVDCDFLYNHSVVKQKGHVTVEAKDQELNQLLDQLLPGLGMEYVVDENVIIIREKLQTMNPQTKETEVGGVVKDEGGVFLPGVTVRIKGTNLGTSTDEKGAFTLKFPDMNEMVLVFSFVGMQSRELKYVGQKEIQVVLVADKQEMEEVVVTGIYTRKSESFTGSFSTFTSKDLKAVGGTNVLQALKTLDPSFNMLENNEFGSDPNRLPDIEIRGKSSVLGTRDELAADPNQPLFILDGFESTLTAIYNLDANRIASITILKDAASTAIYGSKAANGVVVVETVKPTPGKLRLSYNGYADISLPDLSSYNLMNAREKLDFERMAGKFKGGNAETNITLMQIYNQRMTSIAEGVDTYWLAEPLRTGVNHRHSLYAEGGDDHFTFNVGGSYNGITGVMKESTRDNLSGNIDLTYRNGKFLFSNKFMIDVIKSTDPVVAFSAYAEANPYYRKYNEEGEAERWLEYIKDVVEAGNPIYNARQNSRNESKSHNLTNYFMAQYSFTSTFRLNAKFGMGKKVDETESFYSPKDTRFADVVNELERGSYTYTNTDQVKYEGDLSLTYGAVLAEKHQINLVAGGNMASNNTLLQGYDVYGFPSGDFTYPSFSKGFKEGESPRYQQNLARQVSAFANGGYAYDKRYLLDVSYRLNGSSVFGSSRRFANTWAVGLAWNVHNEKFFQDNIRGVSMLKIRASVGNPGNQNFNSFMTYSTFAYNYNKFNYFGMSSYLTALGNPDLKWQTTQDRNIGLDMTVLNKRVTVNADYYNKITDPLLVSIDYPTSSGLLGQAYYTNMGKQISQGVTFTAMGYLIYRPEDRLTWNIRGTYRWESAKLEDIGNKLSTLNKSGQTNRSLVRYYDGADPDDLWAVPSKGIDPATGREVFVKKDGSLTYDFSYEDEVIMGNSRPLAEGIIGSSLSYKGFSVDLNFRYKLGADVFNNALFNKVENISTGMLNTNQDKRALYDRWSEVGQVARYKDIANSADTPISSRFIQRENTLTLESVRVGYEFPAEMLRSWGVSGIRINGYMNDVVRFSTIRAERGISYPFARSFNLSLSVNL